MNAVLKPQHDADFAVAIAVRLNGHVITVAGFVCSLPS